MINLKCKLSEALAKTELSKEDQIHVLTCVAVSQRVFAEEQANSPSPRTYKDLLERCAKLLRVIPDTRN